MIRAQGLTKEFGGGDSRVRAVEGLELSVNEGEVFGFLGPNGAGKTTTVRMLTTLISPTSGRAWVDDIPLGSGRDGAVRARIGVLTESPGLYERLTARRNLQIFAELYGCERPREQVEKYLKLLGLWDRRDSVVGTFSKGMKQKLAIARALVHEPPVLFLDEPTSGLDPEASKTVRDFIDSLRGQGRTIFLCTHNLDEAERLCDRVAVFQRRLIAVDTPGALRARVFGRRTRVQLAPDSDAPSLAAVLSAVPGLGPTETDVGPEGRPGLVVTVGEPESQNPLIVRTLVEHGADVEYVTELSHSMEEVYLRLLHGAPQEEVSAR